jgi:hypothetical protein
MYKNGGCFFYTRATRSKSMNMFQLYWTSIYSLQNDLSSLVLPILNSTFYLLSFYFSESTITSSHRDILMTSMKQKNLPLVLLLSSLLPPSSNNDQKQATTVLHQVLQQSILLYIASYVDYDLVLSCSICLQPFPLSVLRECVTQDCIGPFYGGLFRCHTCRLCQDCHLTEPAWTSPLGLSCAVSAVRKSMWPLCHRPQKTHEPTRVYDYNIYAYAEDEDLDDPWFEPMFHDCSSGRGEWRCGTHAKYCSICHTEVCPSCACGCENCKTYVCESCSSDVHAVNTLCEQKCGNTCALYQHTDQCDDCVRYITGTIHFLDCMHLTCDACQAQHSCSMMLWEDPWDFTVIHRPRKLDRI